MSSVVYEEAINGDQSFGEKAITRLFWLVAQDQLTELDRAVLGLFLFRVMNSVVAINIVCGVDKKRGTGKRGLKGMKVAHLVSGRIKTGLTVEKAWEDVATEVSLSVSAVKQHWIKWKPALLGMYRAGAREQFPDATGGEIDELLRAEFKWAR
jgi:hypothetical protein